MKTLMNYKEFEEIMNKWEEAFTCHYDLAMKKVEPLDGPIYDRLIISMFRAIFGDKADWIETWFCELDFGTVCPVTFHTNNGEITISSLKDVWELVTAD